VNEFIEIDLGDVRLSVEIDEIWKTKEEVWEEFELEVLNVQDLPPSHLKPAIN
jgi:hypothetical protein